MWPIGEPDTHWIPANRFGIPRAEAILVEAGREDGLDGPIAQRTDVERAAAGGASRRSPP